MSTKNKKTKEAEVEQELPKNPQEYSYRGDEMISIPASLFLALYKANDTAIRKGTKVEFPTAFDWVSATTGMPVRNPKEADIKAGKITQVMSIEKTFSQENLVETFEPWLYPDIIRAKEQMIAIHNKAVEDGIATKITDLKAQAQAQAEAVAKAQVEASKEEKPKQKK